MRKIVTSVIMIVLVAGCATTPTISADMSPAQAIVAAAERPTSGTFLMEVKATGGQGGRIFLNSEADYRDQRCLTIEVPQNVANDLQTRLAGDPASVLKGRRIRVSGTAERVRIWFYVDGVKTDKYYFQTHVKISNASQIVLL